jgi:[ribosomal protein S18]-alanine N-acetyltransferase
MRIRPATPADLPALRSIEAHSASAAHWSDHDYQRLFDPEPHRLALVIEESSLQGFLIARQIGPEWEIENIAVADTAQRRGLGSMLLAHFLGLIRQQQAESVFLEVRTSNAAARALYQKHGFAEAGQRPRYYDHPAEDAVLYRFAFPAVADPQTPQKCTGSGRLPKSE